MRWTDSDRVLPEVIYPTTDGLASGVRHQEGLTQIDTMGTSSAQGASRRRSSAGAHLSDDAHHSSIRLLSGKLPQVIPCPSLSIS